MALTPSDPEDLDEKAAGTLFADVVVVVVVADELAAWVVVLDRSNEVAITVAATMAAMTRKTTEVMANNLVFLVLNMFINWSTRRQITITWLGVSNLWRLLLLPLALTSVVVVTFREFSELQVTRI